MSQTENLRETIPVGELGIIPLDSCRELGKRVNDYIVSWRKEKNSKHLPSVLLEGYKKNNYIIDAKCSRFGSGEGKGTINESVRGKDLYILVDVTNYSITYSLCGHENHMSPDDHYADLKRIIAATTGKARRINVIMPFLYESRQHRREKRESLDCAIALNELCNMGVDNILTFDAHDPRVQNAIPLNGFDNIKPYYQFIKALCKHVPDLNIDSKHLLVISPDEGAMNRAVYYATVLGTDVGMFYKRRDYTKIIDGRNPIVAHEYLGDSVEGKDVIVVDDMISSGDSMLDIAKELKKRKAKRVFVLATFGLFTNGLEAFDDYYERGLIDKVLTSNAVYQSPELFKREYYISVDLSKYIALLIDTINHDHSISHLLDPYDKIDNLLTKYRSKKK